MFFYQLAFESSVTLVEIEFHEIIMLTGLVKSCEHYRVYNILKESI